MIDRSIACENRHGMSGRHGSSTWTASVPSLELVPYFEYPGCGQIALIHIDVRVQASQMVL